MQYLTYEEYKEIGGTLELTAFSRNIDRACAEINNRTFGRTKEMREIPQAVKVCCRDVVEYISNHDFLNKTLSSKSQTAGGVSESESYADMSAEISAKEIENIVHTYLANETDDYWTPLLYRGVIK